MYMSVPGSKPVGGTSGASDGGWSMNSLPSASTSGSVSGLNDRLPPSPMATASSGLAMKFMVPALPSLRLGKLRLYEVTMLFSVPRASGRFHWPMQGPQALASTVAPMASSAAC